MTASEPTEPNTQPSTLPPPAAPPRTTGPANTEPATTGRPRGGSLLRATTIMTLGALLLSWLPFVGPLLAGAVGGREAGTTGRAVGAALIPAVVLGLLVAVALAAFELPLLGALAGIGIAIAMAFQMGPLLLGAAIGGASAEPTRARP
jgi:hypothetical protein